MKANAQKACNKEYTRNVHTAQRRAIKKTPETFTLLKERYGKMKNQLFSRVSETPSGLTVLATGVDS